MGRGDPAAAPCPSRSGAGLDESTDGVRITLFKSVFDQIVKRFVREARSVDSETPVRLGAFPVGPGGGDEACFDNLPGS